MTELTDIHPLVWSALIGVGDLVAKLGRKKAMRPSGGVAFVPPPGSARAQSYSAARLILSHLTSLVSINLLGLVNLCVASYAVDHTWPWWTSLVFVLGWLCVWGFGVRPVVYPAAYLRWMDRQEKVYDPFFVLTGLCALVWLLLSIVVTAPMLSLDY